MGVTFPAEYLDVVVEQFRVLSRAGQIEILQALMGGERSVGDLAEELGFGHSKASLSLKRLHSLGVLSRRREGANIYYGLADPTVIDLCKLAFGLAERRFPIKRKTTRASTPAKGRRR